MLGWIRKLFRGPTEEEVNQLAKEVAYLESGLIRARNENLKLSELVLDAQRDYNRTRARIYRAKNYIQDWTGESIEEMLEDKETWRFELKILDILDGKRNKAR